MSAPLSKEERISRAIHQVITTLMDRVMNKVLVEDPFIKEEHKSSKPLYAALVPDEIFKGSHFERRFVTPFGGVWEKLAKVVATEAHGRCEQSHTINGNIRAESLRRIQEVLNWLEHKETGTKVRKRPNWEEELKYILEGNNENGGELIPCAVVCDIFVYNSKTDTSYAFELKAPLPNSDQTKVSKEKLFKLLAMDPPQINEVYYALPYNPYGKNKEDYKWSFPLRWFNMHSDKSVLIGKEFWDLIGGEGTYENFISEINTIGIGYRERIYREFLGIIPPNELEEDILK